MAEHIRSDSTTAPLAHDGYVFVNPPFELLDAEIYARAAKTSALSSICYSNSNRDVMTHRYLPNEDVVSTNLDDEAVLLHLKTKRYYTVNETGARIWDLLPGGKSIEEIAEVITAEFDITREEAEKEVRAFLEELSEEGLVRNEEDA